MRKLRSLDIVGDSAPQILADFMERIGETGIKEESDIVSVQHEWIMMGDKRKSVVRIFYSSDE